MKLFSIVGTRPQFLKLAPFCFELLKYPYIQHFILHSGQHYDSEMSDDLFKILKMPNPDIILDRKGNTPIEMVSYMMLEMEKILINIQPDYVLIYGDCDTTLAGALVSKKMGIKLIHIEAGMRSYNKNMPEEINRTMADHVSDILLCSTKDSIANLKKENIINNVYYVGNLQLDLLIMGLNIYDNETILSSNNLVKNQFVLLTIHRHYNTTVEKLKIIFEKLTNLDEIIIFPIHPRTKNIIDKNNIVVTKNIKLIKPVNYLDMTILERYCKYIITDSGGVQPEAWYLGKKCIVMRSETEWIEPLKNNNNILYDWQAEIKTFIESFLKIPILEKEYNDNASVNIITYLNNSKINK